MLIATWNVNSLKARLPRVEQWLADVAPDVLCIQETKLAQDKFPTEAIAALGYESAHLGQGQWNGVAIVSKAGLANVVTNFASGIEQDGEARIITATCDGVQVSSVYVPNGRALDHDHYTYKLSWMSRLRAHLDATATKTDKVVVAGDFNIAPDDRDVWDVSQFDGATHVSQPERDVLEKVCEFGLEDTFRRFHEEAGIFSWWDYRAAGFRRNLGLRIDLSLASTALAADCVASVIDREPRGWEKPSDHAPVVTRFADLKS